MLAVAAGLSALPASEGTHATSLGLTAVLVTLQAAPLIVRRHSPVAVFATVFAIAGGIAIWNPQQVLSFSLLIALYTVAAMRPRHMALAAAASLEMGTLAVVPFISGGHNTWWINEILASGVIAAALSFGLYTATRRAYLAELRDRADRVERERDQQVALAAAAERARIAREMHDIVAHHLTVMVALSDGAIAASVSPHDRSVEVMRSVSATGRNALADTRQMLGVLRHGSTSQSDPVLQPVPDLADLDTLIEQVRTAGLPVSYEVRGTWFELSSGLQLTVFRLVQESLTNTLKHAGPGARATVRLTYDGGNLHVDVDDNGNGTDAATPVGVGSGLVGMQERVQAFGGSVTSGPRGSGGWHVTACFSSGRASES